MQIGILLSVPAGMLRFKSTVQRILDFQGTLFDFFAVTNILAESCDFGSNLRFLFSEKNLLLRSGTADFVLEFGTLVYQGFQLCFFFGAICQQFFHSFNLAAGQIPGLSVNIIQMPEVSPQLWASGTVGRAFGQDSQLIAVVEVQPVDFGSGFAMVYSAAGAAMSMLVMALLKKTKKFSSVGVSVAGGIFHNVGQIIVAMFVLETKALAYYLPILILSGLVAGILIGILSGILTKRLNPVIKQHFL